MRPFLLSLIATTFLAGCVSQEYRTTQARNDAVRDEITQQTHHVHTPKVTYTHKPPVDVSLIKNERTHTWLNQTITVKYDGVPLSVVLEEVMKTTHVPIWFSEEVDPNHPVKINYSAPREGVLNLLSRQTGYGIEIKHHRLEVTKYLTEVFPLTLPSGKMSGQLGSQGEASSDSDTARIEGQYLNITYDDVVVVEEISDSIKKLLGGGEAADDAVSYSAAMSAITVKATPDQMVTVRAIIDRFKEELEKQVILDIRVLEFRSNLGHEQGIDWNVVRQTSDGVLSFFVPGTTTVSQTAGYGLAFSGSGKWSGTEAFIKVLEEQGSVSTQTPVTALALNNQPAKITQQQVIPYVDEIASDSSEGVISANVTRAKEVEGVDMMVVANVQPEHVWLRISGQLQKIIEREDKNIYDVDLTFLTTQKSEITFANKLRYGQTYVIASIKQTTNTATQSKNFWSTLFGGTGARNEAVETLVLLTPRKSK